MKLSERILDFARRRSEEIRDVPNVGLRHLLEFRLCFNVALFFTSLLPFDVVGSISLLTVFVEQLIVFVQYEEHF